MFGTKQQLNNYIEASGEFEENAKGLFELFKKNGIIPMLSNFESAKLLDANTLQYTVSHGSKDPTIETHEVPAQFLTYDILHADKLMAAYKIWTDAVSIYNSTV